MNKLSLLQPIFNTDLSGDTFTDERKILETRYSRNFGRAWSYVQLCQAIPLVFGVAITGIYFSVGNYVSVVSLILSSLMLGVINIHKHRRGRKRRALRRQTSHKEEKCEEAQEPGRPGGESQSPVRVPIRSTRSYEVSRRYRNRHISGACGCETDHG